MRCSMQVLCMPCQQCGTAAAGRAAASEAARHSLPLGTAALAASSMRPHRAPALLVLACTLGSLAAATAASPSVAAPLFAWANRGYITSAGSAAEGAASHTSMQMLEDPAATLQRLVASAVDPSVQSDWLDAGALAAEMPELVLVVLGSQVKTSDLRSSSKQRLLAPLKELLHGAESSLALPFMMHEAGSADNAQLLEFASGTDKATVVGCGGSSSTASSLGDALARLAEPGSSSASPAVLVVCTQVPGDASGTPAGLAAELQQLRDTHGAAAALNRRQLSVFAVRPDAGRADARRLHALGADVGVCGALCKTQVKWLEGILAAFILVFATFAGMGCLYMLDTPTRFDKPRDGPRNE